MKKKTNIIIGSFIGVLVLIVILLVVLNNNKKFTIEFDTQGGNIFESIEVKKGETLPTIKEPIKEGYIFVGWFYNDILFDFNTKIEEDIKLVARWEQKKIDTEVYVVKFDTQGGNTIANQIVEKGNKVVKPTNPTKEGYIFKGWYVELEEFDFDEKISSDLTIVAKWEQEEKNSSQSTKPSSTSNVKKYTVKFDSNGGSSVASQTIEEGKRATKPTNPTKVGYTFNGWKLNGSDFNFNTAITKNITLVASWTEVIKNNYTVTFNSNGGSNVPNQTIEEGKKATKPSNPTREGYNFSVWLLNGNIYDFNSSVTQNITLVASWAQKTYTIRISIIDEYSPDRVLTVYENGSQISVRSINYLDGTQLCSGSNMTVNKNDIVGESSFIVVLNGGTQVTATIS